MGFSLAEKQIEIDRATIAAIWRRPDTVVIDEPEWLQVNTPSATAFWFNGILRCLLDEKTALPRIEKALAQYQLQKQASRWLVGPNMTSPYVAKLLESLGVKLHHQAYGMVAETNSVPLEIDSDITIEKVTMANVAEYAAAATLGWNNTTAQGTQMLADMQRSIQDQTHPTVYLLARYQGKAAGSGALLPLEKSGYLLASSVPPEFRGKGVYRALVAKRLEMLREKNIPLATIQAMTTTSAPICERLGFEIVSELSFYIDQK